MRLFDNFLEGLDEILSKKVSVTPKLLQTQRVFSGDLQKGIQATEVNENIGFVPAVIEGPKVLFTYDKGFLEDKFGINPHSFPYITIGPHPDFKELPDTNYINHHCVSVFVDIKGSTRLIEKYSLLEVRLIKDSLLTLSIQVANQFGGHVHRLQGDGIFLQFVRRDKNENDDIINALNATSILTQFVTKDLADIMKQFDLHPLTIRVGIDFGKADKVLWSYYGIPGCNELTTTSLHTDMAAKLQSKAYDNSILIGGNIKEKLDLNPEFISIFESEFNREKVYNISNQFTYKFFVFNWQVYLLSLPYIGKSSDGKTLEVKEKQIHIECYISDDNGAMLERFYPNSRSIPKGKKIEYRLKHGNTNYIKPKHEKIEWFAYNSGREAENQNQSFHDFSKSYHNNVICKTSATYLGHHYVKCKIFRNNNNNIEEITFPIFIR